MKLLKMSVFLSALVALACGGGLDAAGPGADPAQQGIAVAISPLLANVAPGGTVAFGATVTGTADTAVAWSVEEGAAGGTVSATGLYTAPATDGSYHVLVASAADTSKAAVATVTVAAAAPPPPPPPTGAVAAFPGCEGAGCAALGGRGGSVIKVTNTANSGAGSLRACVQASGPRTCVFTVGGRINLTSELAVTNPYLTIAGQTAPGGGIEVVGTFQGGYVFGVRARDVVVRYVRFFNDANPPCSTGSQGCGVVRVLPPSQNVVLDHVGAAYTQDENLSVWSASAPGAHDITVSWVLNAYPLADHPTGTMISGGTSAANESMTDIDFHHNYYANVGHRIFMGGAKRVRWAYNVAFNYQWYISRTGAGIVDDFVGNIYRCGNQSSCGRYPLTVGGESFWPTGTPSIYFGNNVWKDAAGRVKTAGDVSDAGQWSAMVYAVANSSVSADSTTPAPTSYRRAAPNPAPAVGTAIAGGPSGPYSGFVVSADGVNLETAMFDETGAGDAARGTPYGPVGPSRSLDCNGNLVNNLDGLLRRAITEYVGGGSPTYAPAGGSPLPSTQTDICWAAGQCGIPALAAGAACADADGDGMPDAWEAHWGLDPGNAGGADGASGHKLSADYTNLEMYLNGYKGF